MYLFTSSSGFSFASFGLMMKFSLLGPGFPLALSPNLVRAVAFVNRCLTCLHLYSVFDSVYLQNSARVRPLYQQSQLSAQLAKGRPASIFYCFFALH